MKSSEKRPRIKKDIDKAYRDNESKNSTKNEKQSPVDRFAEKRFSKSTDHEPTFGKRESGRFSDDQPRATGSGRKIVIKKRSDGNQEVNSSRVKPRTTERTDFGSRPKTRNSSSGGEEGSSKPYARKPRSFDDRPQDRPFSNDGDRKFSKSSPRSSRSDGSDSSSGRAKKNDFSRGKDERSYSEKKPFRAGNENPRQRRDSESNSGGNQDRPKRTYAGKENPRPRRDSEDHSNRTQDRPKRTYTKKSSAGRQFPGNANPFNQDSPQLIRLNRYLSISGVCSRREADELIKAGVVSVNGVVVTELGSKVLTTDHVVYGGETLKAEKLQYLLLNKPKGFITTTDDPEDRKTVMSLITEACKERLYPVGRLDRTTTGLLLMTNDGDLTKKLMHPKFGIKKVYHVTLDKSLRKEDMQDIADGVNLEGEQIKVDDIAYVGTSKREIGIEIHSGQNRVVRRIFEKYGYDVVKLDRTMYAGLTKKDLPRGRWRFLDPKEVSFLKMIK